MYYWNVKYKSENEIEFCYNIEYQTDFNRFHLIKIFHFLPNKY